MTLIRTLRLRTPKKRRSVDNKWNFSKTTYLFLPVKMKLKKKNVLILARRKPKQ